jgi:hypothetical protein
MRRFGHAPPTSASTRLDYSENASQLNLSHYLTHEDHLLISPMIKGPTLQCRYARVLGIPSWEGCQKDSRAARASPGARRLDKWATSNDLETTLCPDSPLHDCQILAARAQQCALSPFVASDCSWHIGMPQSSKMLRRPRELASRI